MFSARSFLAWMVSRDAEETWAGPRAADTAPGSPGPFQTHNFLLYNVSKLGLDAPPMTHLPRNGFAGSVLVCSAAFTKLAFIGGL